MLNQQPEELSADENMSVTSQEMASAITAIEKRKTEQAQRLTGTAQVRQVVQELGIDATPEEVLAEVRNQRLAREAAQRAKEAAQQAKENGQRAKETAWQAHADTLRPRVTPTSQYPFDVSAELDRLFARVRPRRKGWWRTIGSIGLALFILNATLNHHFNINLNDAPTTITLSKVADDQTVHANMAALVEVLNGTPETRIMVDKDSDDDLWSLTKHNGQLYIEAKIQDPISPATALDAPLKLYNSDDNLSGSGTRINVPVEGVHLIDKYDKGDDSTVTLTNVHLDSHAYDDWDWDN